MLVDEVLPCAFFPTCVVVMSRPECVRDEHCVRRRIGRSMERATTWKTKASLPELRKGPLSVHSALLPLTERDIREVSGAIKTTGLPR